MKDYYHNNPDSSITSTKLCLYSETDAKMFIQALKLHESLNSRQKETSVKCVYEPGCRNNAAFKLAKTLREKNRSTLTTNTIPRYKQDVVTIEDCVDSTEGTKFWIESLGLLRSDKEILRSRRSWLNSSIIDASQHLLSRQSSISGFQSVGCAYTMSFAVQRSFIQIIHDQSRNQWLVISNSSNAATVNVYDSLFHDLSPSSEQQIASIMNTQYNQLKVDFIDAQRQSGPDDCGLFAIAFATTLCNGKQPESMFYDQQKMRSHLLSCFEAVLKLF